MEHRQFDVIIVGGASAGLSAALYTSRQGLSTLVITKDIGGQALLADYIENYPGIMSVGGSALMESMKKQAEKYGTEFLYEELQELHYAEQSCFEIKTNKDSYETCALILAFGKTPRDLGVPGEHELKGKGVSYCAVCDGPLFRNKDVAVVGSGIPALDAGNLLVNIARKIYMIQRTETPIGDSETVNNLIKTGKVEFVNSTKVVGIKGEGKVGALDTVRIGSNEHREINVEGVFVEMGYVTKTEFLRGMVEMNGLGEIIVSKDCSTSMPGIFAAGDVTDIPYKQAVISAGMGATAALSAYNYVQRIKGRPVVKNDWKKISTGKEDKEVSLFLH
ncbi:MAG: FAD-dependent oxidoreductase [Candidatus Thermoplasmatota archaeon]|nr:FAD-dependent oxidoreductase [Candidatus Thermoplasmatota archaeon]